MIKLYSKINCGLAPVLSDLAVGANFYFWVFEMLDGSLLT